MSNQLDQINAFLETGVLPAAAAPRSGARVPAPGAVLSPAHRTLLTDSAISDEVIDASGIVSDADGILFPWSDGTGETIWQHRPDKPLKDADGRPMKYLFPKGAKVPMHRLRDGEGYDAVILAEGTKQQYAVLSNAPVHYAVYGLSGCNGWVHADLSVVMDRDVFVLFDGDFRENPDVYDAASKLAGNAKLEGARTVRFVAFPSHGKEGVDDVLAKRPEADRRRLVETWLANAAVKLPRRPKKKRVQSGDGQDPTRFFFKTEPGMSVDPQLTAEEISQKYPAALTEEGELALYSDGAYRTGRYIFAAVAVKEFGQLYTPSREATCERYLKAILQDQGKVLPSHSKHQMINCLNGMVDLQTGELLPHDPSYMSTTQLNIEWDPEAKATLYETWLSQACGTQVDDLEEVASTMLDPTRTPTKALFLYGPSRSGKSTFLDLLREIAGEGNYSAVTLHQLAEDKFAAANLYGKMLNVAADLSSRHVEELDAFKMATGEDVISANRKYGAQFTFKNRALFAFSANELPTVSESSRAYAERMKPVSFPHSFAGKEDTSLKVRLKAELPGILLRWVKAYQRFLQRGGYMPTDPKVRAQFERSSDRVAQFVADQCDLTPAVHGSSLRAHQCSSRREIAQAFGQWAERNGGHKMGERKLYDRLLNVDGVVEIRMPNRGRGFNVVARKADEDRWDDDTDMWGPEDNPPSGPQGGPGTPVTPAPAPVTPTVTDGPTQAERDAAAELIRHDEELGLYESRSDLRDADHDGRDAGVTEAVTTASPVPTTASYVPADVNPLAAITGVGFTAAGPDPVEAFLSVEPTEEPECDEPLTSVTPVTEAVTQSAYPVAADSVIRFPEGLAEELAGQTIGWDIETRSADELYTHVSTETEPFMTLGGVITEDGRIFQTTDPQELIEVILAAGRHHAHNGMSYDIPVLAFQHGGDFTALTANAIDTRTLAILDEPPAAKGATKPEAYDLDAVAQKFGHEGKTDNVKALAKEHGGFHLIPLDQLSPYLDGDLRAQLAVWNKLSKRMGL